MCEKIFVILVVVDVVLIILGMSILGVVFSKIYEAMVFLLSIVIVADGELVERVLSVNCGFVVDPGNIEGFRLAISTIFENEFLCKVYG